MLRNLRQGKLKRDEFIDKEKPIIRSNCCAGYESFFSRFKAEPVEGGTFSSVEEARSEVFRYIEGYYNRIRLHSGLGYKSPSEFEKQLEAV